MKTEAYLIWRRSFIIFKTCGDYEENMSESSKNIEDFDYSFPNTCVSRKNTNYCFWTFHLRKFGAIELVFWHLHLWFVFWHAVMTLTISLLESNYELWTECDVLLKDLESFDGADVPYNISIVLYIAVMWVFLTFVSKLLVLNHMRNDVEQPNLHVCREMAN